MKKNKNKKKLVNLSVEKIYQEMLRVRLTIKRKLEMKQKLTPEEAKILAEECIDAPEFKAN